MMRSPLGVRRRQAGMTLVEVTVASVIFAMIMLAVVTATEVSCAMAS